MIGNDIVDLVVAQRESKWRRRGFLDKVCNNYEQEKIAISSDPDALLWRYWSMKEAAYKAHLSTDSRPSFRPTAFGCNTCGDASGYVAIGATTYQTHTTCNGRYVHTTTLLPYWQEINVFLTRGDEINDISASCRAKAKTMIAQKCNYSPHHIQIIKNSLGIPQVWYKGELTDIVLSMSHHGSWAAICIGQSSATTRSLVTA